MRSSDGSAAVLALEGGVSELETFVTQLSERLRELREATADAARAEHPQTIGAIDVEFLGDAVRSIDEAFLEGLRRGDALAAARRIAPVASRLGRRAVRVQLSMEHLTEGIRTYQRLSWGVAAPLASDVALPAAQVAAVAEAYIAFTDEFTHAAVGAYVQGATEHCASRRLARRKLLAELLVPGADLCEIDARAAACEWSPGVRLRVAIGFDGEPAWPKSALSGAIGGLDVAVVNDDSGDDDRGCSAVFGPPVGIGELHESFVIARRLRAQLPSPGPLRWEEHLSALTLTGDARSARELARARLAPLDEAADRQREWLVPTLRAWLDHQGSVTRVAHALHLHEQSARYRVNRLRACFGDVLDDPQQRFELRMALAVRDLDRS